MKRFINLLILFVLCNLTLNAQTLYTTRMDSIPITGDSVTLKLFEHRGIVQWQRSLDGKTWRNITGEISDSITIPTSFEALYRAEILDDNCFKSYSDTSAIWQFLEMNPVRNCNALNGLKLKYYNDSVCTFQITGPYELNEGDIIIMPDTTLKRIVYNSKYEVNPIKTPECNKRTLVRRVKDEEEEITTDLEEVQNLEEVYRNMSTQILYGEGGESEEYEAPPESAIQESGDRHFIINSFKNAQYEIIPRKIKKFLSLSEYEATNIPIEADGKTVMLDKLKYKFGFKLQVILKYQDVVSWWNIFTAFRKSQLQEFEFSTVQEKTGFFVDMNATADFPDDFPFTDKKLKNLYHDELVLPGGIPANLSIDLMVSAIGNLKGKISWIGNHKVNYLIGLRWVRGLGFTRLYNKTIENGCTPQEYPMNVNQDLKICFFPRVSLTICKTISPYFDYGMYFREDSRVSNNENYDLKTYYGRQANFGVDFKFLTFDLNLWTSPDFILEEEKLFQSPFSIRYIGSDHQCASANTYYLVEDQIGRPVNNCPVYVDGYQGFTSNGGISIPVSWQITENSDFLHSIATIKDRDDKVIDSDMGLAVDCGCRDEYEIFTDNRDGNSYRTITRNGITWMVDNFRYHSVPLSEMNVGSNNNFLQGRAYYYAGNDGVLYNWYAAQTVAPQGWHLPTIQECEEIRTIINSSAWGYWGTPSDNYVYNVVYQCSSFTFGGFRHENLGVYVESGGNWWTSNNFSEESAYYFSVMPNSQNIEIGIASKNNGFSVRFVKD